MTAAVLFEMVRDGVLGGHGSARLASVSLRPLWALW